MKWANFLHFYQPASQQKDILEAIVSQSYRPIFNGLKKHPNVRLSLNINGALLELFDKFGYRDLIDILRDLLEQDKVEITGSAKYHALLPFLEPEEIIRQIKINNETLRFFLGKNMKPKGFFPPEMAYKEELAEIVSDCGFEWIILDEIAFNGQTEKVDYNKIYKIKGVNLKVFFRERRLSNLIMSAIVRAPKNLLQTMKKDIASRRYAITAMDGETFGHHRPGLENLLFDLWETPQFEPIKVSEIPIFYQEIEEISPVKSTWASSPEDIRKNTQFLSWSDPKNIIHQWQWAFLKLVLYEFKKLDKNHANFQKIRTRVDAALSSDHFWWASAKPWWSLEMIEDGAWRLLEITKMIPDISQEKIGVARDFYEKIISTAFDWQRSGHIRQLAQEQNSVLRIPFKDRTTNQGKPEVFTGFIYFMKKKMKEAAAKKDFERAILWRDAAWKLETKNDIYDAVHATDLLRTEVSDENLRKIMNKYKKQYQKIKGGQPEQRGT